MNTKTTQTGARNRRPNFKEAQSTKKDPPPIKVRNRINVTAASDSQQMSRTTHYYNMLLDPCRRRLVPLPAKTLQNGTFGPIKHPPARPPYPYPAHVTLSPSDRAGCSRQAFRSSLWACTYATSSKIQYNVPTCAHAPTASRAPGTAAS